MIAVLFLILSLAWVVLGVFIAKGDDPDTGFFGVFIILACLGLNGIPFFIHINDLVTIRNQAEIIQIKTEAIESINKDLASLPQTTALMNADSPARSLIETKSEYITNLADAKTQILEAKLGIARRKMGPSAWVVWILGDK